MLACRGERESEMATEFWNPPLLASLPRHWMQLASHFGSGSSSWGWLGCRWGAWDSGKAHVLHPAPASLPLTAFSMNCHMPYLAAAPHPSAASFRQQQSRVGAGGREGRGGDSIAEPLSP